MKILIILKALILLKQELNEYIKTWRKKRFHREKDREQSMWLRDGVREYNFHRFHSSSTFLSCVWINYVTGTQSRILLMIFGTNPQLPAPNTSHQPIVKLILMQDDMRALLHHILILDVTWYFMYIKNNMFFIKLG